MYTHRYFGKTAKERVVKLLKATRALKIFD